MQLKKLIKKEFLRQIFLFLFIGGSATILNYLIFISLFKILSLHYLFAVTIGYLSGLLFTFILNKKHTFHSKEKTGKSMFLFILLNLFFLLINLELLYFFVELININATTMYFLLLIFTTPLKFIGSKILIFKNFNW